MSVEQNKALDRQWYERINAHDLEGALTLLSPNFVDHALRPDMPAGVEGVRMFFSMQYAAFPDMHATMLDQFGEGDKVVHRIVVEATHQGTLMGIPPTGKRVKFTVMDIIRVADGKMAEHWGEVDTMGLMQQLGVVPPPSHR